MHLFSTSSFSFLVQWLRLKPESPDRRASTQPLHLGHNIAQCWIIGPIWSNLFSTRPQFLFLFLPKPCHTSIRDLFWPLVQEMRQNLDDFAHWKKTKKTIDECTKENLKTFFALNSIIEKSYSPKFLARRVPSSDKNPFVESSAQFKQWLCVPKLNEISMF